MAEVVSALSGTDSSIAVDSYRGEPAGQSISSVPLLQPLPGSHLLWSSQYKGRVSIAPGLFLTVSSDSLCMRDTYKSHLVACCDWIEMFSCVWVESIIACPMRWSKTHFLILLSQTDSSRPGFTDRSLTQP